MGNLRLKSFVHYGDFIIKKVSRFEEIAGENVILAHRLMKNSIDISEYIVFTENVTEVCDLEYLGETEKRTENFESLGEVPISVFYPNSSILEDNKIKNMSFFQKFISMNRYFKNMKSRKELAEKYVPAL